MRLTKIQRAELKQKYGGNCAYCGELLGEKWDADHFTPIRRNWEYIKGKQVFTDSENPENDNLENMMPSCKPCNNYKTSMDIDDFRKMIAHGVFAANRDNTQYQRLKRYGLIVETDIDVIFYFERFGGSV